jgi:hypothetical protein
MQPPANKRNGFGGFNRVQCTTRAQSKANREARDRCAILHYLRLQYGAEPLELLWAPDHAAGPCWIARYDEAFSFGRCGPQTGCRLRACVIRGSEVEEIG